jgi:hypothetical protein
MRTRLPAAVTAAALAFPSVSMAQTQKQLDACNFKNTADMQQVIAGCTAHIKSGKWKGVHLGLRQSRSRL